MHSLIKEFSDKIASKKAYWIPLLFYTFGSFGFSMLNLPSADLAADGAAGQGILLWIRFHRTGKRRNIPEPGRCFRRRKSRSRKNR